MDPQWCLFRVVARRPCRALNILREAAGLQPPSQQGMENGHHDGRSAPSRRPVTVFGTI